jgi:hypothetical protein
MNTFSGESGNNCEESGLAGTADMVINARNNSNRHISNQPLTFLGFQG